MKSLTLQLKLTNAFSFVINPNQHAYQGFLVSPYEG